MFRIPTTTTTTPTTTTTTTTTTTITTTPGEDEDEEEDDLVLDFSSGKAETVENTATKVEVKSEEQVSNGAQNAFSKFRELIDAVGVNNLLEETGNVTMFSPVNNAFDKLPINVEDVPLSTVRRWILKHFVKGFLFRRDMVNGPVSVLFLSVRSHA